MPGFLSALTLCALVLLYMCPHTTICVLILLYPICVLILQYVSSYYDVSSYYYICVLILPHVSSYYNMCPHTTICVLILLHMPGLWSAHTPSKNMQPPRSAACKTCRKACKLRLPNKVHKDAAAGQNFAAVAGARAPRAPLFADKANARHSRKIYTRAGHVLQANGW